MSENFKQEYTKENKTENLEFSISFKKDGESFQNIMEKILLNKINKK